MRFQIKTKTGYAVVVWAFAIITAIAYICMIYDIITFIVGLFK